MDTSSESRFHKKVFWKVKVPTADQLKKLRDDDTFFGEFELIIGPAKLYCYPIFNKKSRSNPNDIGLKLSLSGREWGDKTIFKSSTNVSVDVQIVGTKRIISLPACESYTSARMEYCWEYAQSISYKELQDPSNGFIVDGMFTFFIHVDLTLQKASGSQKAVQKALARAFADNKKMFLKESLADFKIETNDKVFEVNKFALASRSPVFRAMFSNNQEKSGAMKVTDIKSNVMEELLRYIYCNEVKNLNIIFHDLAVAANKYQVGALKEMCCNLMCSSANPVNVLNFLIIADMLKDKKLTKECLDMISCIKDILQMIPEWEKLTPQLLEIIEQHEMDKRTSNTFTEIFK